MMASSNESDVPFPCDVHGLLGNLTRHKYIGAPICSSVDITLTGARTPSNRRDGLVTNDHGFAAQPLVKYIRQLWQRRRRCEMPNEYRSIGIQRVQWLGIRNTHQSSQRRVIAEFRMPVQRHMVGEKTDIVRDKRPDALRLDTHDTGILRPPEITVMHQDRIRPALDRGLDQSLTGGDTGDQVVDVFAPFDLQAVRTVVAKPLRLE